ncbi:RNA-binding protein 34 isoform X2 [Oncorhynchus mykiss]|uniref:RNA-binding protein 34 isoform X1 n=1 Tax=Oncorhynchus mykiss TaxID=8022 RepID=UPI001878765D|nr:RNA-binding protein 34 isoform X1 [Oncorhynchus mykiss]XP_036805643.1 RNA-binding protein 34 isoform X2 [Oncorhynchus mykiss]
MKNKLSGKSEGPSVDKQSMDYVVGSVSGSLFPKESASSSGSLSALFQAAPVVDTLFFVPAPKPEPRSVEVKEGAVTKVPNNQKQTKKAAKDKSAADLNLENRESALQNADEDEQVPKMPKKTKRKAVEMEEGGATEEEERQTKKQRTGAQIAAERVKQKRTVFVGNLPASCTKKTLQLVFKDQGAIESIRFRSVVREDPSMSRKVAAIQRKVHPKKQSINAYVVFEAEEGAEKALERNGMEIEKNFHIRVDRVSKSSSHDHKRSIFIGNLPFDINELPVRQHFEECGKVEGVRLVRDKNSGMGKGFGYILFQSIDAVQLALKLDSSKLLGRSVRVKRSVKKEKEKKVVHRGPRGKERETKGAGKEPTKGGFKGRPGQGVPHNKSSGRPQGKGPQMKSMGKPFKKSPGEAQKATTGPSSFKGEMADPNSKKAKAKALKKKLKPRKRNQVVHI